MISFLISKEFWLTTIVLVLAFLVHKEGILANIIQDVGLYGWAYVIWKMEKNHRIVTSLFNDNNDKKKG